MEKEWRVSFISPQNWLRSFHSVFRITSGPLTVTDLVTAAKLFLYFFNVYDLDSQCASGRYLLGVKVWQHDAGGAHPQRTQQLVDDAVDVVQRQGVQDDVVFGPRPLQNQTLDLVRWTRGGGW